MRSVGRVLAALVVTISAALLATAALAETSMPTGGPTSQPVGHYDFCRREPASCGPNDRRAILRFTPALWEALERVNILANSRIEPRTDEDVYGVPELWTYPTVEGDCEDFVLLKQRALELQGMPASALLITVVRQSNGDGHAVLTVLTDRGDYVLDNLDDRILPWDATPYTFVKRQSAGDQGRWVSIEDSRDLLVGSVR